MQTGCPNQNGQSPECRSGSNLSEPEMHLDLKSTRHAVLEAYRSVDQVAADDTIAQRILDGTWAGQEQVGPEHTTVAISERRSFDRGVVRGGSWQPCDVCGQEFHDGDVAYQQAFPFHGKTLRLCASCFLERYTQASPSISRDRSFDSGAELPDVEIRPLHHDPHVNWLASQGGRMSSIQQHIHNEMQRLLGPVDEAPSHRPPQDTPTALHPTTPRQLVRGRPMTLESGLDSLPASAASVRGMHHSSRAPSTGSTGHRP